MKIKMKTKLSVSALLALILSATLACPVMAFEFSSGKLQGSLDTTLSYGIGWRMEDPDNAIFGNDTTDNGIGEAYSQNYDDGNLNYDKGDPINNTAKVTSELALQYENFGLFVRGTAFYDFENNDGDRARTPLRDEALDMVGKDAELLDAYLTWDFSVAEMPAQIRVGDQVLSWGESTFIQNGINVINPFDVSKLRVAGAELKEGLVPVGMVSASISPTENITFEGFYQYKWEEVKIDPPGSYWSTNDFVGEGGDKVMLGWGAVDDAGNTPAEDTFMAVPRAADVYADDDGQYGVAMRVYAPGLNDTEFGFYYMNYHSRLPVISAWTGDGAGLAAAGNIQTAVAPSIIGTYLGSLASGTPADLTQLVTAGVLQGATVSQAGAIAQTVLGLAAAVPPAAIADVLTNPSNPLNARVVAAVTASVTDAFAKTARYQVEYPEDIQLFGMSFNTVLPASGIALQGEISHRIDVPLQADDIELLFAAMGPLSSLYSDNNQFATHDGVATSAADLIANLGNPIYIPGYRLLDVTQIQTTATKLFGPTFGADQFTMVGEVGLTYVHDMPSKDELRFDSAGTPISGNATIAAGNDGILGTADDVHYGEFEPATAYADATSWGYRLVAKLDFNNAIGAVTLSPRVAWAHDVSGNSPGPGGNFLEGRKAVTLGLGANYMNKWTADLSYTDYFGAGRYNLINDRDFVALNIKYSF
ncbi:MAG: DUF1302 domain-containing protein [Desulfuromonadales bacterium]|nr:DUF1302 domain-containing protein [Desulfuromonadales bacterium]MBN2792585.1 DUF1302 domain-containing protein [Desulfuromonadales bacterium]